MCFDRAFWFGLHISNNGDDFDNGEEELCFAITLDTKQVDPNNDHKENGHKYSMVIFAFGGPEIDGNGC